MKRVTKNHESIAKDYESLFYSMKDQCKKNFRITSQAIHSNSPVLAVTHLAITYSKLTIETLEQGVKYVQS